MYRKWVKNANKKKHNETSSCEALHHFWIVEWFDWMMMKFYEQFFHFGLLHQTNFERGIRKLIGHQTFIATHTHTRQSLSFIHHRPCIVYKCMLVSIEYNHIVLLQWMEMEKGNCFDCFGFVTVNHFHR